MTCLLSRLVRVIGLATASLITVTLFTAPAQAQLSFSFVNAALVGTANQATPLLFQLNLANGSLESFIDGLAVQFDGNVLPPNLIDLSPFVSNATIPDPLPANYLAPNLDFFTVNLSSVAPGSYNGFATFTYTTDGVTETEVSRPFTVSVVGASAAPEPTTAAYGVLALGTLGAVARRPKR